MDRMLQTKTDDPAPTPHQTRYLKALSHPLRLRILQLLCRGIASPKELADELNESLGVVSYHVRTLEELGCIELAETRFRRGAVQHFYRPLRRAELSTEDWSLLPRSEEHTSETPVTPISRMPSS